MFKYIISPQDLSLLLPQGSGGSLAVVDCRFNLAHPREGRRLYRQGHIPGAVYLDLEEDLSGPKEKHGGRHPLPDLEVLAAKLGRLGISRDTKVVAYDHGDFVASRLWWLLRYMGHDQVQVLDGGYPAWLAEGYPISLDTPQPEAKRFLPERREEMQVDVEKVRQALTQPSVVLLDSREGKRYRGEEEPLDPVAGHIPGAELFFWKEALRGDGRWKSPEEQRLRLSSMGGEERRGVPQDGEEREWILYCGSGVSAYVNVLALEEAGVPGVKLYTGSWSDWCSYPHLPVEKGEKPL